MSQIQSQLKSIQWLISDSADEDSEAETINTMESSLPDPDVTLDDDLIKYYRWPEPCPLSDGDGNTALWLSNKFQCTVILQYTVYELFEWLGNCLNWLGGSAMNPTVQAAILYNTSLVVVPWSSVEFASRTTNCSGHHHVQLVRIVE